MPKYKDWTLEYDDTHHIYIFKSPRGGAKSSSVMGYGENGSCIGNFIENFEMFYWIRRKESEILSELPKLIPNGIMEKYGILDFKCKKGGIFITFDKKNYVQCGFYGAISTFKKGQRNFQNVTTIVFDEYNDTCELVTNEKFKFWNAIATIVDKRSNYKIVFLGNESIYYSPYEFLEKKPDICKVVEINEIDKDYIGTPLYQAVSGTDVGDYMFESNFYKNFKYFYNINRFEKIKKELFLSFNNIDFIYIPDDDKLVLKFNAGNKSCTQEEFVSVYKKLKEYYNTDKIYYYDKVSYKKVSQYLPEFIK